MFALKSAGTLDKTLVAHSDNEGKDWTTSGSSASNPFIDANMWGAHHHRAHAGTTDFFTAYPAAIQGKGHGYRVRFYNRKDGTFSNDAAAAIVPKNAGAKNGIFHLTAVDSGQGPVLLYWLDLEGEARVATVRGRLILGNGQYSKDFAISKSGEAVRSFALDPPNAALPYWYDDFWTAGGYRRVAVTHTYYPLWVDPDQAVHFTRVDYVE